MEGNKESTGGKGNGNGNESIRKTTATEREMGAATRVAGDKEGNTMARAARAMAAATRVVGMQQQQRGQWQR